FELLVEGDAPGRPWLRRLLEGVPRRARGRWRYLCDRGKPTSSCARLRRLGRAASRRLAPGGSAGGGGGGRGAPGGALCGGRGSASTGGWRRRSLRCEGFVAEVQILKRIDVFRCAGHRLNGQTTCPPGDSPKAASLTRPHPTCPPAIDSTTASPSSTSTRGPRTSWPGRSGSTWGAPTRVRTR